MKERLFLLLLPLLIVSCNSKSNDIDETRIQMQKLLQGAWYTTTLEANGQVINTQEHPETLSYDKVKLLQIGNNSENVGTFNISNDTVYICDIINNTNVMSIKIKKITENNLDITILGQNVKMMMERINDEGELNKE